MRYSVAGAFLSSALLVASCGNPASAPESEDEVTGAAASTGDAAAEMTTEAQEAMPDYSALSAVLEGEWRGEAAGRDAWRHPRETLEFFGVDPSSTVVEIWPGGGWYSDVLAPWIAANDGQYIAAHFPEATQSEYRRRSRAAFEARMASAAHFGDVRVVDFGGETGLDVEDGSVDAVLTFRNVHNWMNNGFAERAFEDFHDALRPGGILGVVEHRLPSSREQDPMASSGYVQQDYVIAMAEEAGFELVETSEINANPADTADHPMGVWTLPPVRRSPEEGSEGYETFDRAHYDAIGESDRMTLLFRKPDAESGETSEE